MTARQKTMIVAAALVGGALLLALERRYAGANRNPRAGVVQSLGAQDAPVPPASPPPAANLLPAPGPIGLIHLSGVDFRSPANPRGWWHWHVDPATGKPLDARAPDYPAKFRAAFLLHAQKCAERARKHRCKLVLVWDIEGQEHDHPTSYLGDPRMLPPEMPPKLAGEFFEVFLKEGLNVGGTVRHTVPLQTPYGVKQVLAAEPATALTDKINWGRRNLGWRAVYVDSNTAPDNWAQGKPKFLPADVFRQLRRDLPDTLMIVEWSDETYATVPGLMAYRSTNGSDDLPAGLPAAFVISKGIDLKNPDHRRRLREAMERGGLPFVSVDYDTQGLGEQLVDLYYATAGK